MAEYCGVFRKLEVKFEESSELKDEEAIARHISRCDACRGAQAYDLERVWNTVRRFGSAACGMGDSVPPEEVLRARLLEKAVEFVREQNEQKS